MTHAMMITAAHLDENGKPVRFRIENSWGPNFGDHGFFMMTLVSFQLCTSHCRS